MHLVDDALIVEVHISESVGKQRPGPGGKRACRRKKKAPIALGNSKQKKDITMFCMVGDWRTRGGQLTLSLFNCRSTASELTSVHLLQVVPVAGNHISTTRTQNERRRTRAYGVKGSEASRTFALADANILAAEACRCCRGKYGGDPHYWNLDAEEDVVRTPLSDESLPRWMWPLVRPRPPKPIFSPHSPLGP
jgi:hypothetical protein